MIDTDKLTVGMLYMVRHAIDEHRRKHFGDHPQRFELHPALRPELVADIHAQDQHLAWAIMHELFPRDVRAESKLYGIPVRWTVTANAPRMVTSTNEIEYL